MVHQLVVSGTQFRVTGVFAQPRAVDQRLRVFNPKAYRERLGLHVHATVVQHTEGVTGTVAQRQDHMAGVQLLAIGQYHAGQLTIVDQYICHALLEAHFATQRFDLLTHVFYDTGQTERTDMRLADVEDFVGCACFHELVQHFSTVVLGIFDLAVQFAVRECPGTAFTKLHVGLRVEHVFAPQPPRIFGALAHFSAALKDDGLETHLCQQQASKNAARSEADHNRAFAQIVWGVTDDFVADIRCRIDVAVVRELEQQRRFITHRQVDGVDKAQFGRFFTRIVAALEQGEVEQVSIGDAQALHDGRAQVFFGMVDRQLEFGNS